MKQKLKLLGFEDKTSAAGKEYTVFGTNEGSMSCFEKPEIEKLKSCVGKDVELETRASKDGKFINIDKVLFVEGNQQIPTAQQAINSTTGEARMNKDAAIERMVMLKEVMGTFNVMLSNLYTLDGKVKAQDNNKLIKEAIAMVKTAREGLE